MRTRKVLLLGDRKLTPVEREDGDQAQARRDGGDRREADRVGGAALKEGLCRRRMRGVSARGGSKWWEGGHGVQGAAGTLVSMVLTTATTM